MINISFIPSINMLSVTMCVIIQLNVDKFASVSDFSALPFTISFF